MGFDTRENMISEWSKVQQLCEEHAASVSLQAAANTLGITGAIDRLTVISNTIREKITQRSSEFSVTYGPFVCRLHHVRDTCRRPR